MYLLKLILITSTLVLMGSCGQIKNGTRDFDTTDPVFVPYIQKFEQEGQARTGDSSFSVGDIPIQFGNPENAQHQGVCEKFSDGTMQIKIRQSWWDAQTEAYRESLIFHELGHCRLNRSHDDETVTVNSNTFKTSMMNSYIVGPAHYSQYKDAYLDELFTSSSVTVITALNN